MSESTSQTPPSDTGGIAAPSDEIASDAARDLGRTFAGVGVADDGSLVVKVLGPAKRSSVELPAVAANIAKLKTKHPTVRFVEDATFSADELNAAWERLSVAMKDLNAEGVRVSSRYIDWLANRVTVVVDATGPRPSIDLGPEVIVVSGPYPGGIATSRQPDNTPHSGGARVTSEIDGYGGTCTTGYIWYKSSSNFDNFVSAGHCTGPNLKWRNNGVAYASTLETSFTLTNRGDWAYADISPVGSNGHPSVYSSESSWRYVDNYFTGTHGGVSVCQSGSATVNERCGFAVTSTNICVTFNFPFFPGPGTEVCGLNGAFKSGSAPATLTGDSGGPVYRKNSDGRVTAAGIVTGVSIGNPSVFYYTPISEIMANTTGFPYNCGVTTLC